MAMDFNKLKDMARGYVEKGVDAAKDLTEKGKSEALILNNQAKLAKAQRQLGALVYSLAKSGEENQPLVDKYIEEISAIEQEIENLKAGQASEVGAEVEVFEGKVCPQCAAQVDDDALFCNKCGAQL